MKIKVKFSIKSWAGEQGKQSPAVEKELIMSIGDNLDSKDFGGFTGPRFKVTNISDVGIEIKTTGLVEPNPNGTVDLRKDSLDAQHSINLKQTLELVTQSMDGGFNLSITPLETVNE